MYVCPIYGRCSGRRFQFFFIVELVLEFETFRPMSLSLWARPPAMCFDRGLEGRQGRGGRSVLRCA